MPSCVIPPPISCFPGDPRGRRAWRIAYNRAGPVRAILRIPGGHVRRLFTQLARFGIVGAVGFVVDFGVFNLLRLTVFTPEQVHAGPVYAKVVSTALAILVNWIGNR